MQYALTASTNGTFTITVDPANCGSNLDPPKAAEEGSAAPQPPRAKGPDPAKRKKAKAARKARRRSR